MRPRHQVPLDQGRAAPRKTATGAGRGNGRVAPDGNATRTKRQCGAWKIGTVSSQLADIERNGSAAPRPRRTERKGNAPPKKSATTRVRRNMASRRPKTVTRRPMTRHLEDQDQCRVPTAMRRPEDRNRPAWSARAARRHEDREGQSEEKGRVAPGRPRRGVDRDKAVRRPEDRNKHTLRSRGAEKTATERAGDETQTSADRANL